MTRELFWLTLTVIFTGLLWIPYVLNRCQVRGLGGAMANPSRNDKPHAEWANRLMFAHDNAVENLIIFAPLVLILPNSIIRRNGPSMPAWCILVPGRTSDRLHDGPAGVPHTGVHRRLLLSGGAWRWRSSRSFDLGPDARARVKLRSVRARLSQAFPGYNEQHRCPFVIKTSDFAGLDRE